MKSIAMVGIGITAGAAIACCVAACSSPGSQQNAARSATASSASPGPATPASQSAAGGSTTGGGAALPAAALSTFLMNVVKGDFVDACDVTAGLQNERTLVPSNAANCAAASTNAQVKSTFAAIQKAVTPAGAVGATPVVKVRGVSATGPSVKVMPNQITIDNQSLQGILAANRGSDATPIESFQTVELDKRWYIVSFL
jgi:hypothetical protein